MTGVIAHGGKRMLVLADFVDLPRARAPVSLALTPTLGHVLSGHVRLLSQLKADALDGGEMIDRGTFHCPCEIDIDLSKLFERAGPSYAFDFFFEPQGEIETKIDVELHRTPDGRTWGKETLLMDCRPGVLRSAPVRKLLEERLRLRMRFVSKTPGTVRVWMREPRRASELRKLQEAAMGARHG